jgi:ABC-type Na+ transport system ATPase subunit NatA
MATLACEGARIAELGGPLPDALTFASDAERLGLIGNWHFLVRLLLGEVRLFGGRVELAEVAASEALRRGVVGIATKDAPLPKEWTVDAYLRRAAELSGHPTRSSKRLAARTLDALGVTRLATRKLRDLELAERRALSLAQAALDSPAVLVADRPFDALHDGAAEWVRAVLERAAAERRLIFCAGSAMPLGENDRYLRTLSELVVLSRGSVVRRGDPPTVLASGTRYLVTVGGTPQPLIDALGARGIGVEWPRRSGDDPVRYHYHRLVVDLPEGMGTEALLDAAIALDATIVEMAPLFGPAG